MPGLLVISSALLFVAPPDPAQPPAQAEGCEEDILLIEDGDYCPEPLRCEDIEEEDRDVFSVEAVQTRACDCGCVPPPPPSESIWRRFGSPSFALGFLLAAPRRGAAAVPAMTVEGALQIRTPDLGYSAFVRAATGPDRTALGWGGIRGGARLVGKTLRLGVDLALTAGAGRIRGEKTGLLAAVEPGLNVQMILSAGGAFVLVRRSPPTHPVVRYR